MDEALTSDDGNGSVGNYDDSDDGDLNMSVMAMNVMMQNRHSDEGDECDGSTGVA